MRLLAWVLISCFLCSVPSFADSIYRAGEKVSSGRSLWHGEISGGYVFSSQKLQDFTEESSSRRLQGAEMRALWAPVSWLSVGIEAGRLGNGKMLPVVAGYHVDRLGGIIKLNLSPDTTPRFYLLGGLGRSKHKLDYNHDYPPVHGWENVNRYMTYWMIGLGIEADVWKSVFMAVEGNWTHYSKTGMGPLFKVNSAGETSLHLRVGVRF